MSKFSDFLVECCGKYLVRRYKVKPFLKGVLKEEYKQLICPNCGMLIIERMREVKKKNGTVKRENDRLSGLRAKFYLELIEERSEKYPIFNNSIEKGSKNLAAWYFYLKNKRYDLNNKRREDLVSNL